jgi:hypothetical protein
MEALIRARPLMVTVFLTSVAVMLVAPLWRHQLIVPAVIGAHVALWFFLFTESFGHVSRSRGKGLRVFARVCFVFSSLLFVWMVAYGLTHLLS